MELSMFKEIGGVIEAFVDGFATGLATIMLFSSTFAVACKVTLLVVSIFVLTRLI